LFSGGTNVALILMMAHASPALALDPDHSDFQLFGLE
jgi:hypothetical protein